MKHSKKQRKKSRNRKEWLLEASRVHRELQSSKVDIDKIFPTQEYLHPLSRVPTGMQIKIAKFLRFKIDRLVSYDEVKGVLEDAKICKIDKGNILYTELKSELKAARNLKEMIKEFESLTHRTYAEAKYLFAQVLKRGVWMNTARVLKKIINVNTKIENFLMGNFDNKNENLKQLTEKYSEFIDSGFKKDISSRHQEMERAQRKIDMFLKRRYVEFTHFEPLELLMKELNEYPYTLPNFSDIKDLHSSFVWVIKLALKFKVKTKSLSNLVEMVRNRIRIVKGKKDYAKYESILKECLSINFSKSPIIDLMQEVKLLFWAEEAKQAFEKEEITLKELENLLAKAPDLLEEKSEEVEVISMVSTLVETARNWVKKSEHLNREMEDLFKKSLDEFKKDETKGALGSLENRMDHLLNEYNKDLVKIQELKLLSGKIHKWEDLISFFKTTYSILKQQKIELNDYQKSVLILKFLDKLDNKMSFKGSQEIVEKFRNLKNEINPDMKLLQRFYKFIQSKKSYVTPVFYEIKFKEYVKKLKHEDDVTLAVETVSKHVFMSELGFEIKDFLNEFKNQKNLIIELLEKFPLEELDQLSLEEIRNLKREFEKKREKFVIRVNFKEYEKFEIYEWCMNAAYFVKCGRVDFLSLKNLESYSEVILKLDKNSKKYSTPLCNRIKEAENLSRDIDEFMMKKFKKEEILEKLSQVESGNLFLKSKEKTLRKLLQEIEMLEDEIKIFKEELGKGEKKDFRELRGLYNDLISSRFLLIKEEDFLRNKLQEADDVIQSVMLNKDDKEKFLEFLEEYKQLNIIDRKIEGMLKSEEKAKIFLSKMKNIETMSLGQVKNVEKTIAGVFYPEEYQELSFKILKRQVGILKNLSKKRKIKKRITKNLISLGKLRAICKIIEASFEDLECDIFTSEEKEWCSNRLIEAEEYLSSLKKRKKPRKGFNKILFNFLDLREEISRIELIHEENVINVEIPEIETITKKEKKKVRKDFIKKTKEILSRLYNLEEKQESVEKAKEFEMAIYSENKASFEAYKEKMKDYTKVLEFCAFNPYLNELLGDKVLKSEVVNEILNDREEKLGEINSLKEARRYVRMLSAMTSEHTSHSLSESNLKKREFKEISRGDVEEDKVVKKLKVVIEEKKAVVVEEKEAVVEEKKPVIVEEDLVSEEEGMVVEVVEEENKDEEEEKKDDELVEEEEKKDDELVDEEEKKDDELVEEEIKDEEEGKKDEGPVEEEKQILEEVMEIEEISHEDEDKICEEEKIAMVEEKPIPEPLKEKISEKKSSKKKQKKRVRVKKKSIIEPKKVKKSIPKEPENPSKIWSIFEGNIKLNILGGVTEPMSLITFNSYQKITKTPSLNFQTLEITEFIKLREFKKQLQNLTLSLKREKKSKKLVKITGFVHMEPTSRQNLSDLGKVKNNVYRVNIDDLNIIYILHSNEFLKISDPEIKAQFKNYTDLCDIDSELYFMLLSSPENEAVVDKNDPLIPKISDFILKKRSREIENLGFDNISEDGNSINWEEAGKQIEVKEKKIENEKKIKKKSVKKKEMDSLLDFNLAMSHDDNFEIISQQEEFDVIANANLDLKKISDNVFKDATNLVNNKKIGMSKMGKLSINSSNLNHISRENKY